MAKPQAPPPPPPSPAASGGNYLWRRTIGGFGGNGIGIGKLEGGVFIRLSLAEHQSPGGTTAGGILFTVAYSYS